MNEIVAIVILNRNETSYTRDCLASLRRLDYPNCRILVVDNGSVDDSLHALTYDFPGVNFLFLRENRGVAGGRNAGIREVLRWRPQYILLLDNDTEVAPDFLSRLVAKLKTDQALGAVQPKILFQYPPQRICTMGGRVSRRITHCRYPGSNLMDSIQCGSPLKIDVLSGCAFLSRADVFREVGLLDETHSPYGAEDIDWSLRLAKAGYRMMCDPSAVVWHRVSSHPRVNPDKTRNLVRARVLLLRSHTKVVDLPLSISWNLLHVTCRVVFPALFRRDLTSAMAVFAGVWEGLRQKRLAVEIEPLRTDGESAEVNEGTASGGVLEGTRVGFSQDLPTAGGNR